MGPVLSCTLTESCSILSGEFTVSALFFDCKPGCSLGLGQEESFVNWSSFSVGSTELKMVSYCETEGKGENKTVCDGVGTFCCLSAWTGNKSLFIKQ